MNGAASSNYDYNDGLRFPIQPVHPGPQQTMAGYSSSIMNGNGLDNPRYNALHIDRSQDRSQGAASRNVDLKDPIQVHLLTETALSDSKKYEVLSQEEVDDLKKQIQSLSVRIEQAKANLAVQTKYRDAAIAMTRLYHSAKRMTVDPKAAETHMEREASERACEKLATELFDLEKRIMDPQRRLLQHTAGILHLTHSASSNKDAMGQGAMHNGRPGSPESLYMYKDGRASSSFSNDDIDDRSLYFPMDDSEELQSPKTDITVPPRSPVRERTAQLLEEVEQLKQQGRGQLEKMSFTAQSLQDLNTRLRDLVIEMDPVQNADYRPVPGENAQPGVMEDQLDYMTEALAVIQNGRRDSQLANSVKDKEASAAILKEAEKRMVALNRQAHQLISSRQADHPAPPEATGSGLDAHFEWMDKSIPALRVQLDRSAKSSSGLQQAEQMETVLAGLWEIIQSGYAEINRQRESRKEVRLGKGLPDEEDDVSVSADESFDLNEPYSLNAFSAKVQWLFGQATGLQEEKSVLKRQIRQQRELNNRDDGAKVVELRSRNEELQRTQTLLSSTKDDAEQAKREAAETRTKLDKALSDLKTLQTTQSANNVNNNGEQLRERNKKIASLEADSQALQDKLEIVEAQLVSMSEQLGDVGNAKDGAALEAQKLEAEIKARDEELEQLNMTVVELKTELTIARAELDGAYGSRSERAAEAAALNKNKQMEDLRKQIEQLKGELASTVKTLEDVTKETVASEREKVDLELRLDDMEASRGSAEAELANLQKEIGTIREKHTVELTKLKEQLESEMFKAGPNATNTGPRAGATALSEQFRATMKEERKKFQVELREEQGRRRKLEDELRTLKKASGVARNSALSTLGPRE